MKHIALILTTLALHVVLHSQELSIEFFNGEGCGHCAKMEVFLEDLHNRYPTIIIKNYEIYHNPQNRQLFIDRCQQLGIQPGGVPTIFIGKQVFSGFSATTTAAIESLIRQLTASPIAQKNLPATPITQSASSDASFQKQALIGKVAMGSLLLIVLISLLILFLRKKKQ